MDFPIDFDLFLALTGLSSGEHGNWILSEDGIRSSVSADEPSQTAHAEFLRRRHVKQAELSFPTTAHRLQAWERRNDCIMPEWLNQVVDATPENAPAILADLHERFTASKDDAARRSAMVSTAVTLSRQERRAAKAAAEQAFNEALMTLVALECLTAVTQQITPTRVVQQVTTTQRRSNPGLEAVIEVLERIGASREADPRQLESPVRRGLLEDASKAEAMKDATFPFRNASGELQAPRRGGAGWVNYDREALTKRIKTALHSLRP